MTKRKENAVIITHGVDPDGIVSAAYIEDILRANGATWRSRMQPGRVSFLLTAFWFKE